MILVGFSFVVRLIMIFFNNSFFFVWVCFFDMDGLLFDIEDFYMFCINLIFEKYGCFKLFWSIKVKL